MNRTKLEFVEQDPLVKQLSEHQKQQHETIRDHQRSLIRDARKVGHLLLAFDCVVNKMSSLEDVKDEENILESVTGDDSEIWWGIYDAASDAVLRAVVDQCRETSLRDIKIKRLTEDAKSTCKSLQTAVQKARARYDEMQKEAASADKSKD
jgi:hypothetical protein